MNRKDIAFWASVSAWSIASVALFKILAAQRWVPDGVKKLAAAI